MHQVKLSAFDGLLLLRSMFGLSDDALTTGVVSPDCVDCDATKSVNTPASGGKTYADLNSTDGQNISGSSLDGTTLTIGIENGQSETVDLSSLEDGTGITAEQASAIEAALQVGITPDQASAIANTRKQGSPRIKPQQLLPIQRKQGSLQIKPQQS